MRLGQRGAAAGDDALLERGPGRRERILDPEHALLELDAGGAAYADDRDPARSAGRCAASRLSWSCVDLGPFALRFELADPGVDERRCSPCAADDGGVVLGGGEPVSTSRGVPGLISPSSMPVSLATTCRRGPPRGPRARRPGDARSRGRGRRPTAWFVHVAADEQLQRRAVDVLGEDDQRRSARLATSSVGMMSWTWLIFLLVSRISGFSSTASIRSWSVTM